MSKTYPIYVIKLIDVLALYKHDPLTTNPWNGQPITRNSITIAIRDNNVRKKVPPASADIEEHIKHIAYIVQKEPVEPVEIELARTSNKQVWGGFHALIAAVYSKSPGVVCFVLGEYDLVKAFLKHARVPNTRIRKS